METLEYIFTKNIFYRSEDGQYYYGSAIQAQEFLLKSGIMLTPYDGEPDELLALNIGHELEAFQ
jgi:hypothetical protein